jgi:hypothetical protein
MGYQKPLLGIMTKKGLLKKLDRLTSYFLTRCQIELDLQIA